MKNLTFTHDTSYHARVPRDDFIHHLLGNGRIQAMIQVTENLACRNALVLHLMNPDRFEDRPKSSSFTYHQQAGPEMTLVSLYANGRTYVPHPRQTAFDLQYGMAYDDGVPTFQASYPADFTLEGERAKSAFNIVETFFCTNEDAGVVRRIKVINQRGLSAESARLLAFLVPNQALFPEAHYLTGADMGVAGHFARGDEFLALAALSPITAHQVAEFPLAFDDAADGQLGNLIGSFDDDDYLAPQGGYTNYPLLPGSAHLGPVITLAFDLGPLEPGQSAVVDLLYLYGSSERALVKTAETLREKGYEGVRSEVKAYWAKRNTLGMGQPRLDKLYEAVRAGVRAGVAESGRMNAAIWGYNAEWVRDSSCASLGATFSGQFETARAMLNHIVADLISDQGMAFGESQFYEPRRAELDQNGEFIFALWQYWVHSRDDSLIRENWPKLIRVAEFPIGPDFWVEEAAMLKSERDQRDRDAERHGLKEGFELSHQMWNSLGLAKAADMARHMGDVKTADRWDEISGRIWDAVLHHPTFNFIEDGYLMKRRLPDGTFQRFAHVIPYVHRIDDRTTRVYPRNRGMGGELEPDGSEAWPIALGMIDPDSDLTHRTLLRMESLWNFNWDFGGYPLHHPGSDPTKQGAWPMIFYFVTQAALEAREYDTVRRNLDWILSTKDGRGYTWWEYRDADPALQIDHGITPWFSYGEAVFMFVHHLLGYRPGPDQITIAPHLLPEMKTVTARLRQGQWWLDLTIHNNGRYIDKAERNGRPHNNCHRETITMDVLEENSQVEIWLRETPRF
ncbi:MAG: hypothetical protein WAM60_03515 [Candidatus Promineifilaceae bacterium]